MSSPSPTISVVVPCYKVRAFVVDAVRSLFRQTLQEPFEIVLVDDGDPDNSIEEVKKVEAEKPAHITLRYLRREHNGGLSAARNTGTDAARGQYVLYLDSDDELYPEALSLLLTEARKHGAVITLGLAREVTPDNVEQPWPSFIGYWNNHEALSSFLQDMDGTAWNKLVPLSFLREKRVRFVEGLLHEDEVWNIDLLLAGADIMGTPHITYKYKIGREGSIMGQNNWRHYQSCIEVCNHNANSFEASPTHKVMRAVHNRLASCIIYYQQSILRGIAQKGLARRIPECRRLASATLALSPTLLYHLLRAPGWRARIIACVLYLPVPQSIHVGLLALFFFLLSLKLKI